jgi:hypothetical protein
MRCFLSVAYLMAHFTHAECVKNFSYDEAQRIVLMENGKTISLGDELKSFKKENAVTIVHANSFLMFNNMPMPVQALYRVENNIVSKLNFNVDKILNLNGTWSVDYKEQELIENNNRCKYVSMFKALKKDNNNSDFVIENNFGDFFVKSTFILVEALDK